MAYDVLDRAVKKAFDKATIKSDDNLNMDADVKFYESLTPEAFDVIASTYGPDNLMNYIEAMEVRRTKGIKNGNQPV